MAVPAGRSRALRDDREAFVADRPAIPLVVFDGDCAFCRQWVERGGG